MALAAGTAVGAVLVVAGAPVFAVVGGTVAVVLFVGFGDKVIKSTCTRIKIANFLTFR